MSRLYGALTLGVLTVCLESISAQAAPQERPSLEVVSSAFGTFDGSDGKAMAFEARNQVKRQDGQLYGWVIQVKTERKRLVVREDYLIPLPPEKAAKLADQPPADGSDPLLESLRLPPQRRNQISERLLSPVNGQLYGVWASGPNEPKGHRHLQVFVDGELAGDFEFDVE